MRKYLVFVAAIAMVAGVMLLTGCNRRDPDLVGTWAWELDASFTTTFNDNGTGTHSVDWTGYGTRFDWRTSSSNIYWDYPGHDRVYTPYSISGDVLTFTMGDGTRFRYNRVR